jgi:thiamine biosynthesis protein ThiS
VDQTQGADVETGDAPAPLLVNGEAHPWRPGLTVAALLAERGADGPGVAVERNLRVVRRADHATELLEPGDRVEIVSLVGGG